MRIVDINLKELNVGDKVYNHTLGILVIKDVKLETKRIIAQVKEGAPLLPITARFEVTKDTWMCEVLRKL